MRRIERLFDDRNDYVLYELPDRRMVRLDYNGVREYGAAEMLRRMGLGNQIPKERVPVFQDGRRVGTISPDFDPDSIKSRSFMYDPRPGDFRREADRWVANNSLGTGDLGAVPGFRFE